MGPVILWFGSALQESIKENSAAWIDTLSYTRAFVVLGNLCWSEPGCTGFTATPVYLLTFRELNKQTVNIRWSCLFLQLKYTTDIYKNRGDEERPDCHNWVNGYPTAIRWTLQQ